VSWQEKVKKRHLIEWYNHSLEKITGDEIDATLQFATEEQPVFNRQFNMLIGDLQKRKGRPSMYLIYLPRTLSSSNGCAAYLKT
jgi:hypothetical protein